MSLFRKDENGQLTKTAGYIVQRWNDRLFPTIHTVENNADYYEIDGVARKYITGLTDYTEFQLYIAEPNVSNKIYIKFNEKTLRLNRIDFSEIAVGALFNRLHIYTLDTSDGNIWMDSVLQPTPDTYHGVFTYAVQTLNASMIPAPKIGDTLIALDTNLPYEYDGTDWERSGDKIEPYNGWYWMIEFFPDYYFGNGKIIWNGETDAWNIYTANTPRPDEDTIKTNKTNNTFYADLHNYYMKSEVYNKTEVYTKIEVDEQTQYLQSQINDLMSRIYTLGVISGNRLIFNNNDARVLVSENKLIINTEQIVVSGQKLVIGG